VLSGASIVISGTVESGGQVLSLATVAAYNSLQGSYSVRTDALGAYSLNLPQPSSTESWTIGASKEGYIASSHTLSLTSTSNISQDFALIQGSKLSWSSFEVNGQKNLRLLQVQAQPAFQSGDEAQATAQFLAQTGADNSGFIGAISYSTSSKTLNFNYTFGSTESKTLIDFKATPTGGTLASTLIRLDFSEITSKEIPIIASHFIDRVRGSSGDLSAEKITENGVQVTDYAGFEVPTFGVSANVDVIRIERKNDQAKVSGIKPQGKVYKIDAYAVSNNTETLLGSENIHEILLTFPYDPMVWSPINKGKVYYSTNEGVTWLEHDMNNLVYVDTLRNTITLKSTHLSLWTLGTSGEGLFGNSGAGGGAGGGCFFKSNQGE